MALPDLRRHCSMGQPHDVCGGPADCFVPGASAAWNIVRHLADHAFASCECHRDSRCRAHLKDRLICWPRCDERVVGRVSAPTHRPQREVSNFETLADLEKTMGGRSKRAGKGRCPHYYVEACRPRRLYV